MAGGKNIFDFLRSKKGLTLDDAQNFILQLGFLKRLQFKKQFSEFIKSAGKHELELLQTLAKLVHLKSRDTNNAKMFFSEDIQKNLSENLHFFEQLRKEKQFYLTEKGKIVVWDIDGPVNQGRPQTNDDCYEPEFRNPESNYGEDLYDFIVSNKTFLRLTLEILHANEVISVIGSQRIQMDDGNKFSRAMYEGLDFIFGHERPYLNANKARKIGLTLLNEETNESKNSLLKAYQNEFKVRPESVIFVDDNENYKIPAEEAGYIFIHAPRKAKVGSLADNAYLYETLLRTIPASNIHEAIAKSNADPLQKNEFKKQLLEYQLNNITMVTFWQSKILVEEKLLRFENRQDNIFYKMNRNEQAAKHVLQGIQFLIMDTQWDIGYFGGENIVDLNTGKSNVIPKGMNLILKEIDKGLNGSKKWSAVFNTVDNIVKKSALKKDHCFFNKRGETTQIFYERTKEILNEAREQELCEWKFT
ncbi:MAG: hypothetical protein H0U57_09015 [Tatlockia sp.]|nr:hypothetical protein [Tatlockia sp.]